MAWALSPAAQEDKEFLIKSGVIMLFFEVKDL
jgi:hypothetical protein